MPPRIRSPSPESEYDELEDSPDLPTKPLIPARHPQAPPASTSRQASITSTSTGIGLQTAQPSDDDDLSSLEESEDERGQPAYDDEEDEEDDEAMDDGGAYSDDEEMDELDELDELEPTPKKPSAPKASTSAPVQQASNVKIKFKLGGGGGAKAVVTGISKGTKPSASGGRGSAKKAKGKGKGKKVMSEPEISDISDDDFFSDASNDSSMSGTRLTARQRAKEMGGPNGMELQSLPNQVFKGPAKAAVKLSEAEIALKRSEMSRKRKHQSDKRLEDEKTETINRLLKKQVGRQRSKLSSSTVNPNNQSAGGDEDGGDVVAAAPIVVLPPAPTRTRFISSIKDGEYKAVVMLPVGRSELVGGVAKGYPGPRPPLKTRRLVREVVV